MNILPKHMVKKYTDLKTFKKTKRRQIASVIKTFDEFQDGSAYAPGWCIGRHAEIVMALEAIQENLKSDEDWGQEP